MRELYRCVAAPDVADGWPGDEGDQLGFQVWGRTGEATGIKSSRWSGRSPQGGAKTLSPAPETAGNGQRRAATPQELGGHERDREEGGRVCACERGERESGGRVGLDPTDSGLWARPGWPGHWANPINHWVNFF
jgi:hypothetical protein